MISKTAFLCDTSIRCWYINEIAIAQPLTQYIHWLSMQLLLYASRFRQTEHKTGSLSFCYQWTRIVLNFTEPSSNQILIDFSNKYVWNAQSIKTKNSIALYVHHKMNIQTTSNIKNFFIFSYPKFFCSVLTVHKTTKKNNENYRNQTLIGLSFSHRFMNVQFTYPSITFYFYCE